MRNQSGFTLIELLIASLIAALITTLLFTVYWQINKTTARFDNYVDIHYKAMLLQRVLERDLSGATIPLSVFEYEKQQKEKKEGQKETESRLPKIDKIFYATTKNNQIDLLTCITNNPLPSYWSEQLGKPKPAIVRVVYRLQPDRADKRFFSLWRQESTDLSFDAFGTEGKIRSYELISELKELSFSFTSFEDKEGPEKKKKLQQKTSTEWNREEQQTEEQKKQRRIPQLVTARAVIGDKRSPRVRTYEFTIAIIAEPVVPETAKTAEKKEPETPTKKEPVKTPVPPAKSAMQLQIQQQRPTIAYNGASQMQQLMIPRRSN